MPRRFVERLELRLVLDGSPFSSGVIDIESSAFGLAADVSKMDVDGDSMEDIVVVYTPNETGEFDGGVAWFRSLGDGSFSDAQVVVHRSEYFTGVSGGDIDGDGDMDLLVASDIGVTLYENVDGTFSFSETIVTGNTSEALLINLDVDSSLEIIVGSFDGRLSTFDRVDGNEFSESDILSSQPTFAITAFDVDDDGDVDIVAGGFSTIEWYENDGVGGFGARTPLSGFVEGVQSLYFADLDGDGDKDLLSASSHLGVGGDSRVAWYENRQGQLSAQKAIRVAPWRSEDSGTNSAIAADVDGDGDQDIVTTSSDPFSGAARIGRVAWYENSGAGDFSDQHVIADESLLESNAFESVVASDIDRDGLPELVVAAGVTFAFDDSTTEFARLASLSPATGGPDAVVIGDMDQDGNDDVVVAAWDGSITLYRQSESREFERHRIVLNSDYHSATGLTLFDIDSDGDLDIFAAFHRHLPSRGSIGWVENLGTEGFGDYQTIEEVELRFNHLEFVDLNQDGQPEILARGNLSLGGVVALFPYAGDGKFSGRGQLHSERDSIASFVETADVDSDGDADVLLATNLPSRLGTGNVQLIENLGGGFFRQSDTGTFGIGVSNPTSILATDFDQDGDTDVLAASSQDGLRWFENNRSNFETVHILPVGSNAEVQSIQVVDADRDGDNDVVWMNGVSVGWIENRSNLDFRNTIITDQSQGFQFAQPHQMAVHDIDGDGAPDIVYSSFYESAIRWIPNQPAGDSLTSTGDFNSDEIVNADDIDALAIAIASKSADSKYDLNEDAVLEDDDRIFLIEQIIGTKGGDADLNGRVEFADFLALSAGFGKQGGWASGDFDGDGEVAFADFLLLSQNFGFSSDP